MNERFALHGACENVVHEICRGGFDSQRGGREFLRSRKSGSNRSKICIYKTLAMKGLHVDQEQQVWRWTISRAEGLRATATTGNVAKLTEKELPPTPLDSLRIVVVVH